MRGGIDLPRIKTSSARSAPRFDPRACPLHRCSFVVVAVCSLSRRVLSSLACLLRIAASSLLIAVLIFPSLFFLYNLHHFFLSLALFFFSAERGFCFCFCLGFWFFSKAKTTRRGSASFFYQLKFGAIFLFINISKISSQLYKVRTLHPIDLCFCFVRFFQF